MTSAVIFTCWGYNDGSIEQSTLLFLECLSLTYKNLNYSVIPCVMGFYMCCSLSVWRLLAADAGRPSQARLWPQAWVPGSTSGPQPLRRHPSPQRLGTALHALLHYRWECIRSLGRKVDWWLTTVHSDSGAIPALQSELSACIIVTVFSSKQTATTKPAKNNQCECQYLSSINQLLIGHKNT